MKCLRSTCAPRPSILYVPGDYQLVPASHACLAKKETLLFKRQIDSMKCPVRHKGRIRGFPGGRNLTSSRTAAGKLSSSRTIGLSLRELLLRKMGPFGRTPPFEIHIPTQSACFAGLVVSETLTGV
ncbi:hypothetical protein BDV09DRAFT_77906 [Aspergillus tetrazonus]